MNPELFFILIAALTAAIVLLVRQQNFRRRQMEHRERLAAIEKGLLPQPQGEDTMTTATSDDPRDRRLIWFRLTTLGLGFLLLFGGAGMLAALLTVEDPELGKLWSLGLVPLMTGFGLVVFYFLSRRLVP